MLSDWTLWVEWLVKSLVVIFGLLTGFAYLTYYERRGLALAGTSSSLKINRLRMRSS